MTLSKFPGIRRQIVDEANAVLNGGEIDYAAVGELHHTRRFFKEVLRLYPAAWTMSRKALDEDRFGDTVVPANSTVIVCPFVVHRLSQFWENPEGFDPDRFAPEQEEARHPFAYFPFAAGTHVCLGNRFALLEGVLVLAMLAQRFQFHLAPGQNIHPRPSTTLRPNRAVYVTAAPERAQPQVQLAA